MKKLLLNRSEFIFTVFVFQKIVKNKPVIKKSYNKKNIEKSIYLLKFALKILDENDDNWVIGRDIESHIIELEKELKKIMTNLKNHV